MKRKREGFGLGSDTIQYKKYINL